jgi:hypothetical protein
MQSRKSPCLRGSSGVGAEVGFLPSTSLHPSTPGGCNDLRGRGTSRVPVESTTQVESRFDRVLSCSICPVRVWASLHGTHRPPAESCHGRHDEDDNRNERDAVFTEGRQRPPEEPQTETGEDHDQADGEGDDLPGGRLRPWSGCFSPRFRIPGRPTAGLARKVAIPAWCSRLYAHEIESTGEGSPCIWGISPSDLWLIRHGTLAVG